MVSKKQIDDVIKPIYIIEEYLSNIPLEDDFFKTLKADYENFEGWYLSKARKEKKAFIRLSVRPHVQNGNKVSSLIGSNHF